MPATSTLRQACESELARIQPPKVKPFKQIHNQTKRYPRYTTSITHIFPTFIPSNFQKNSLKKFLTKKQPKQKLKCQPQRQQKPLAVAERLGTQKPAQICNNAFAFLNTNSNGHTNLPLYPDLVLKTPHEKCCFL